MKTMAASWISRRRFMATAMGAAAGAALTGCNAVPWQSLLQPGAKDFGAAAAPDDSGPDDAMHVLNRLGFGPWPGEYARVRDIGAAAYIEEQLHPESIDDGACDWRIRRFASLRAPAGELFEYRQEFLRKELVQATVLRAVYSKRQLHEAMVGFWTDHFNIAASKGDCPWLKTADDREVIRKHALGKFPAMVRASATSPAMLWYLDGRANKKAAPADQPNENYARELLELHTLGVHGGYTQQDVMETARCLTGWYVRSEEIFLKGRVEFRPEWHDDGEKVVLGQRIPAGLGAEDLDRVVAIVCAHDATAQHVAEKLCERFAGTEDASLIRATAAEFQASEGDIPSTLRALFAHEAFWRSRDASFKRPFAFTASALRSVGAETDGGDGVIGYLERMGQVPFQYPTPDGYPMAPDPWYGGMLWRWHFAAALADGRIPGVSVDWPGLEAWTGGREQTVAHLAGRRPEPAWLEACEASGKGAVFALALPCFQRC